LICTCLIILFFSPGLSQARGLVIRNEALRLEVERLSALLEAEPKSGKATSVRKSRGAPETEASAAMIDEILNVKAHGSSPTPGDKTDCGSDETGTHTAAWPVSGTEKGGGATCREPLTSETELAASRGAAPTSAQSAQRTQQLQRIIGDQRRQLRLVAEVGFTERVAFLHHFSPRFLTFSKQTFPALR
jgi:hypothetical protein